MVTRTPFFFHNLCIAIQTIKEWPEDWTKSVVFLVAKTGDTQQCSRNRTIALISHCSEILLQIIAGGTKAKLSEEISEEQGFRTRKWNQKPNPESKMIIEKNVFLSYRLQKDI